MLFSSWFYLELEWKHSIMLSMPSDLSVWKDLEAIFPTALLLPLCVFCRPAHISEKIESEISPRVWIFRACYACYAVSLWVEM